MVRWPSESKKQRHRLTHTRRFCGSGPSVKEKTRPVDQGTSSHRRFACSFRQVLRKGNLQIQALSAGEDRGCSARPLGQSKRKRCHGVQGCSYPSQTDALGSCAGEDRRGAEGEMDTGEGGEEDCLRSIFIRARGQIDAEGRSRI